MKDFKGYYRPDFNKLWNEATFVIDASVWLNLYRFSQEASDNLFNILENMKGKNRLWMPYQFVYEYHKNLMDIHDKIEEEYNKHKKELEELSKKQCKYFEEILNRFKNRYGFETESHIAKVKEVFEEISQDFKKFGEDHKCRLRKEPLLENRIMQLIDGIYGEDYPNPRKEEIRKLGENRENIPPMSSKDRENKSDPYGDLIAWFQIIDYAEKNNKPVILITDDGDWFYKYKGKTKRPHPRLVQEMYDKAGVIFYSYKISQFMKHAKNYLKDQVEVSDETIEEIENRDIYLFRPKQPFLDKANWASPLGFTAEEAWRNSVSPLGLIAEEARRDLESHLRSTAEEAQNSALDFLRKRLGAPSLESTPGLYSQISGLPTNDDGGDDNST